MPRTFTVAINLDTGNVAQQQMLRGIIHYCQTNRMWRFAEHRGAPIVRAQQLSGVRYDGLITALNEMADVRAARQRKKPVVAITNGLLVPGFPLVCSDDQLIGRKGAEYFLNKGFRQFAFYGSQGFSWAQEREQSFCETIRNAGHVVSVRRTHRTRNYDMERAQLLQWLSRQPTPLALMASDDQIGRHVLTASDELGLRVPEQVAVLGVDNDDIPCEMAWPAMSSIPQDAQRIGFEAAAWLDQLMNRHKLPSRALRVPPLDIVARRSTDVIAIDDPHVAQFMRLIHEHADRQISVKELVQQVPMSRRTLERRFFQTIGRRPAEEIRRVHLERALLLLRTSSLSMSQVARRSGFIDARGMDVVFRRLMKMPPTAYRRQFRDC